MADDPQPVFNPSGALAYLRARRIEIPRNRFDVDRFDVARITVPTLGVMRGLAGASLMRPDQGKCRNFVIYRRLFARRERPMPARARCGPVCMPRFSSADSIIGA